ncbi:MAG: hypothetical protein K9N47_25890 [Prosthecobacter sp.]|uniref:hypothetical protein n=1 Tax=Prosthecobacter sp. TaxID=1965333 RepID=UPI0026233B7C|nr:hypothetical protein [Prosthecobacter sp.]MCF7789582.1 hypothetical protein [Prosthecobacter sp.]
MAKEELRELKEWGDKLTRRLLIQCAELKGNELKKWVLEEPDLKARLTRLDRSTVAEVSKFLVILGQRAPHGDPRTKELADSLIRAYEFRNFHDVVEDINNVAADPAKLEELLFRLHDWKVLESRAILEIVKGRLAIIERLRNMVIDNRPETPAKATQENPRRDNLHDLFADYPWLFNPEWQVFAEEKSIGAKLREWGVAEISEDMAAKRVDFLALHKDVDMLVIIELKRPDHPVDLGELQRLQRYQNELGRAYQNCLAVLVHEGEINIRASALNSFEKSDSFKLVKWSELFKQASRFYSHYKAVLDGDVTDPGFSRKQNEVLRTRDILTTDTAHRGQEARAKGIGDTEV